MKNAAMQGLTAQTIAENDGIDACHCEGISGLRIHHRQNAAPPGVMQQLSSGIVCQSVGCGWWGPGVVAMTPGALARQADKAP